MRTIARANAGFSLIELMIAMTLGLLLLGAVVTLFSQTRVSFSQNERIARLQEDGRFALETVARELSMAGFLGDLLAPSAVELEATTLIATDCGPNGISYNNWLLRQFDPDNGAHISLVQTDNASGAIANGAHTCLNASEIKDGSDVVAIKHLRGGPATARDIGKTYLRTNGTVGMIYQEPMPASPSVDIPAPFEDWEYAPAIYYVRNFAQVAGDNTPTLCRKIMDASMAGGLASDCLAEGVEDMQIEYGLDINGNGSVDRFTDAPIPSEYGSIISAKISLLVRSVEATPGFVNDKTYQLGNSAAYTPNDAFYRRVFTTSVIIRNLRNLRRMGN